MARGASPIRLAAFDQEQSPQNAMSRKLMYSSQKTEE
jgi:hypothetical protein